MTYFTNSMYMLKIKYYTSNIIYRNVFLRCTLKVPYTNNNILF